ncbi:hypothetical protein ABIB25_002316 [Nakamurella sp. UYEF19]|uniref:hypothetical protein n=1 Tax=Nakamurella sp. UYEF19 TaxID=1756392 RepID=UPI00339091FA
MSQSAIVLGTDLPSNDLIGEQTVRQSATSRGLRLEKSRRLHDTCFGPTLYWLFDEASCRLISSKSGWTLDHVSEYLSA